MLVRFTSAAALLLLSLSSTIRAETSDNVSSRLTIHIPHSLFKEEGYDHREALFGFPPYGGSIAQNVIYADSNLCDPNVDTTKGYPRDKNSKSWKSPFILMVDRGDCTFVKKVRNAQKAGAAGVIIADTTCLCSDKDCQSKAEAASDCEATEPIMADDGSGGDITIPSFLMFKVDADAVKETLKNGTPVQLEMAWNLPSPDDRVEYELFTIPTDIVSRDFMRDWKPIAEALADRAYFTPHWYIYDGVVSGCQGRDGENQCFNLCTNNGRYCSLDPDNDIEKGISGADVIKETLRRICIWKHYGDDDGLGLVFWSYIQEFLARCNTPDYFMNEDCVRDAYKHAKVDENYISRCMRDSGGLEGDATNSFLEVEMSARNQRGVVVIPTAFVNSAAIRGHLSLPNMFSAICAGYKLGTAPKICNQCSNCADVQGCIKTGKCAGMVIHGGGGGDGGGVSTHTFVTSMLFVVLVFSGVGIWHYKKSRDDMRQQVRGILAEYMPLEDQDGAPSGNPMDFARGAGTTSLISS